MIRAVLSKIAIRFRKKKPASLKITSAGLLYLCTGKYEMFFDEFYASFEEKFLPGTTKNYFVFTDSERLKSKYAQASNIHFFPIEHKGWPLGTLLRNRYFHDNFAAFEGHDYLFFCNANLVCKQTVYLNDLGLVYGYQLCGVQHPYFFNKKPVDFIVEKATLCHAYFSPEEVPFIKHYFQGCFYGGTADAYRELVKTIHIWTEDDLSKNIMPVWLDESYLNKYFFKNQPFALHAGFAYPEKAEIPLPKTIVQLDKVHRDKVFQHD